jgi:hypothetical protein
MQRYGYWLIAGLLCWGAVVHAQEQKTEDYVQTSNSRSLRNHFRSNKLC